MEAYRLIPGFMGPDELEQMLGRIRRKRHLFLDVGGKLRLGPRYRVIDGDRILEAMPSIAQYGRRRVMPMAEKFAGHTLEAFRSSRRAVRVQRYDRKRHDFRWHLDGHAYAALLTLENENGGATQIVSPRLSSWLRFLLYPLYPIPAVLSMFPSRTVVARRGDLLLMRGSAVLHRGITTLRSGSRTIVVYAYDNVGKVPHPIRDRIARLVNY